MTQFANSMNSGMHNYGSYNQPQFMTRQPEFNYIVQEPHGKRPLPPEYEMDMDYAPRAKRRFEKISSGMEKISISNDSPPSYELMESSSEDEDMEECIDFDEEVPSSSAEPIISDPDDEPAKLKKIKLDDTFKQYLETAKLHNPMFLPKKCEGNEVVPWSPRVSLLPKEDGRMQGRIVEISEEDEKQIIESLKSKQLEFEGMLSEEPDSNTESNIIVESGSEEGSPSDIGSSFSSPALSPNSRIVELEESTRSVNSPTSFTNGSISDQEIMEFDY